jgi:hypothetical protein
MSSALPEVEGETVESTEPVRPRCDWRVDYVSHAVHAHAERSTYRLFDRRTLTKIQEKVVRQGKRNAVYRFVVSKSDKDRIAAWKQDLVRVLHVFNVRSVGSVKHS